MTYIRATRHLLRAFLERVQVIDRVVVLVLARLLELAQIVLIVTPDALYGALRDGGRARVRSGQRREADIRESVVVRRDNGLEALLQLQHRLQEVSVEDRPEDDLAIRRVVLDLRIV